MVSLSSDDTAAAKAAAAAAAAVAKLEAERTRYDNMVNPTVTMNRKARLRPELKEKISVWILSFYHLDPRYKILTFFNLVASEGADNVTDDQLEENHSYAMMRSTETNNNNNNNSNNNNSSKIKGKSNGTSTSSSSKNKNNNSNNKSNGSSSSMRSTPLPLPRKASAKRNSGGGRQTASSSATAISSSATSTTATTSTATGSVNPRQAYQVNAHLMSRPSARNIRPSTLSLLSRIFNATSILTVWRPCSNDAMRKMMEGTGVGKGLDIKGKSAKKGKLSAFVPFMQIFHNEQKHEIQPISVGAEMRIYYKDEKLRDHVLQKLQDFLEHGPPDNNNSNNNGNGNTIRLNADEDADVVDEEEYNNDDEVDVDDEAGECESQATEGATNTTTTATTKGKKTKSLSLSSCNSSGSTKSTSSKIPDHKNPNSSRYVPTKLKKLKKYAKTGYWGIECSQRLFWYATIEDADISRTGTGTETGRPSLPGFQDANMKTLKIAHQEVPKPTPMPVILQYKSLEDCSSNNNNDDDDGESQHLDSLDACLDPRFLVMAYEEQGTIKPVVSDFDGFLLGWRREALWFGCNLPRYQEELMVWCVDRIEEILEDQKKNPTNSDTWTQRWLEVKKKAAEDGFHIETPEYGFGDPKSTSIMEHAALKLKSTGAVRHGSECFNYGFPQEIDDMFLVISDTLKPVPWKYVNIDELQAILTQRIAEGFVFPINPKWILCDPGWKKIFDDLMASEALYADLSKDVWYPPHTGIREKIDDIYRRHPNGFQRCTDKSIVGFSKGKKDKIHPHGRRQSATNILRDTLDDGIGSELTGNAFADLAELELDDFLDRTSTIVPNKMGGSGRSGTEIGCDMMKACKELDDENSLGKSTHHARTDSSSSLKKGVTFPGGTSYSISSPRAFGGDEKRGSFVSHTSSISSVNSNRDSTNPDARRDTSSSAARLGRKLLGSSSTSSSSSKSRRNIRGSKSQRNIFRRKHTHDDGRACDDDCASEVSDAEMRRPTSAPDLAKEEQQQQSNTKSRTHRFTNPFLKFTKKR